MMTRREFTLFLCLAACLFYAFFADWNSLAVEASTRRHANLRCYSDDAYERAGLKKPVADWARHCWIVTQ